MTQPSPKSALERMVALRAHLLSLDSGSGEAADLALLLAVAEAAQEYRYEDRAINKLDRALTALNSKERANMRHLRARQSGEEGR